MTCPSVFIHHSDHDTYPDGSPVVDDFFGDDATPGYSHCTLPADHHPPHRNEDGNEWNGPDSYKLAVAYWGGLAGAETTVTQQSKP